MIIYHSNCPTYLNDFLTYLRIIKGRTEKTVEAYYSDISIFLRYIKIRNELVDPNVPFEEITISDIPISYLESFTLMDAYEYLNYLSTVRMNNSTTRARRTTAIKSFYNYLYSKAALIKSNQLSTLERPKESNKLPKYLDLEQSYHLLESTSSTHYERDYCILTLFLNCGMRLSELVGLNIDDYSKTTRTLRLFGKGQKERIVYINNACIDALDKYLAVRPKTQHDQKAIFVGLYKNQYNRLSNRSVQKIVEKQLMKAGLGNRGISVHKLRHTCATLLYEYGNVDPMVLRDVLGHASVATTQIYTHLSDSDKQRAAESSPLASIKNNGKTKKE